MHSSWKSRGGCPCVFFANSFEGSTWGCEKIRGVVSYCIFMWKFFRNLYRGYLRCNPLPSPVCIYGKDSNLTSFRCESTGSALNTWPLKLALKDTWIGCWWGRWGLLQEEEGLKNYTGSPIDFWMCWAANNLKEPWNLFPCLIYLWAFNFASVIETCCSDRDFWFHRNLRILLQQKSLTGTVPT